MREQCIDKSVVRVGDEDEVMVKVSLEPKANSPLHPVRIVFAANLLRGILGGGDALDFTQYALAVVSERARE